MTHEVQIDLELKKTQSSQIMVFCLLLKSVYSRLLFFKNWKSKNYIMKNKGSLVKVMLLNEVVKSPLYKLKHEIETFRDLI
jgi:hypothetical protein